MAFEVWDTLFLPTLLVEVIFRCFSRVVFEICACLSSD